MVLLGGTGLKLLPRLLPGLMGFLLLAALSVAPAEASLLPAGFFDQAVKAGEGPAAVEADRLSYDKGTNIVAAEGGVLLSYHGYLIKADRLEYNQKTGDMKAVGHVVIKDTQGNTYTMDSIAVTGGTKEAVLDSMTLTTANGAVVTARDVHYADALQSILTDATYSPCGLCEDTKGQKIGWRVKAARMTYDRKAASVTLEQPSLELLGIPVAWLPWFWAPDPTQPRATGLRMPSVALDDKRGVALTVPYFIPAGEDVDIILSPTLMSRQGILLGGNLTWRPSKTGEIDVSASGLYQADPSAFAGTVGDRPWRGAIQTSGKFTPTKEWTLGWSYSVFTDNNYLRDYGFTDSSMLTNEAYATQLTSDTYFDARIQSFHRLGSTTDPEPDGKQALVLPKVTYDHVQDLAPGWGRVHVTGELLSVLRAADQAGTFAGVDYGFGLAGAKQHLMLEGAWENRMILQGGITATPYLGGRLDVANYDGGSTYAGTPPAPPAQFLLSATPIAAMDFRWPFMAHDGSSDFLLEPVAQLVYRGSSNTAVGITNDDAHSFVFDDTNLFSYNRFSGIDRQETGLRANLGGHFLANFDNGGWLDMVAGQSFHLAGTNALGIADPVQVGTSTGLGSTASYLVAGARGGFGNGISFGSKLQLDPSAFRVTRAGLGVDYSPGGHSFSAGADYIYVAADPALGITSDQHEVSGNVGIPIADYWTLDGSLNYDLGAMDWMKATAAVTYDDGYLVYGVNGNATPTSWGVGLEFKLKGPDHKDAF